MLLLLARLLSVLGSVLSNSDCPTECSSDTLNRFCVIRNSSPTHSTICSISDAHTMGKVLNVYCNIYDNPNRSILYSYRFYDKSCKIDPEKIIDEPKPSASGFFWISIILGFFMIFFVVPIGCKLWDRYSKKETLSQ